MNDPEAPFDSRALFDVLAEAAETLHRPGPLDPKFSWAVRATRLSSGARLAAYLDLETDTIRASSGATRAEAQALCNGQARTLVDRTIGSRRPSHRLRVRDGPLVVVPVPRVHGLHGLIVVEGRPGDAVEPYAWIGEGIGSHLGVALDNTTTIAQLAELEAAQREVVTQLHDAVRPQIPEVDDAEFGVHYLPADRSAPTGGDLYDWHRLPDGDIHVAVVDVVGKGLAATKDALSVVHALRLLALDDCPMDNLVARADEVLAEANPSLSAAVAVARYSPSTGRVAVVAAGNPPPLLIRPDVGTELLDTGGLPIGFPQAGTFSVVERTLERDDALLLYTDGLVESGVSVVEGLARLETSAADIARYPARFLARSLVERNLQGALRRDDTLALVVRHRRGERPSGATLGPFHYRFSPSPASVPLVRHLLADWLRYQPLDEAYCDDLLFVATELCTNAVRASSGAPESVELRARIEGDGVRIEVEDDGRGFAVDPSGTDPDPEPEAEAGRGLFLVRALTDRLEITRDSGRTTTAAVKWGLLVDALSPPDEA